MAKKTHIVYEAQPDEPYFLESSETVLEKINSNKEEGLSGEEAEKRLERFGPNELAAGKRTPAWKRFLLQFNDFLIYILIAGSLISIALEIWDVARDVKDSIDPTDAIVIFAIIIANAIIGFIQEGKADEAIEKLREAAAPQAQVIRDGMEKQIYARELVPGDIVIIHEGSQIPADGRLIEAVNLKIDEASLTGESVPVNKKDGRLEDGETPLAERKNMMYLGTIATYGRGKAVITRTGMNTEFGKIAKLIQDVEEKQTPLQEKLDQFGKTLGYVILGICGVVMVTEIARLGAWGDIDAWAEQLIVAVSLAIAAIPEGLPAVVTTCLAIGVTRMTKKNAIIKKLPSVETLGCTDIICSDKTGTLTKNEMTVKKVYVDHQIYEVSGTGYIPEGTFTDSQGNEVQPTTLPDFDLILKIGLLCNNSRLATDEKKGWIIFGDPTEGCLIVSAEKAGIKAKQANTEYPRVYELPFDSTRKKMSVICNVNGQYYSYIKGAAEIILEDTVKIVVDGVEREITQEDKDKIMEAYNKMASDALRGLGFAYKKLSEFEDGREYTVEELESDVVFVGLQTMIDPPREETKPSIELCRQSGIAVKMITGDNLITAKAIAAELGITTADGAAYEGKLIGDLTYEEIEACNVFARVSPEHKQVIVEKLQGKNHIVAMTGDGVNDAPALKMADVGVAMGITGTDVSKEASDMVLADDKFNTIVTAVEEGRGIYDNIKKFIMYLLSSNIAEVLIIFFAIIINMEVPLIATQILWINLVTDGLPGVALSVDPYDPSLMARPPRDPSESIITRRFASTMVIRGVVITIFILFLYWMYGGAVQGWLDKFPGWLIEKELPTSSYLVPNWFEQWYAEWAIDNPGLVSEISKLDWYNVWDARSTLFNCLVIGELINAYNSRSEYGSLFNIRFFSNMALFWSVIISLALTVLIFYVPFASTIFRLIPLSWDEWLITFAFATPVFFTVEILKIFYRKQMGIDFHLNVIQQ
ncbi:MAG: HAD-IC family P-type ATPase [Candidatus Lokiarchaeota archaeon]|nr:HAD-IC family P-type ATPase [Candidatus Lokiarchaeota archaeon]